MMKNSIAFCFFLLATWNSIAENQCVCNEVVVGTYTTTTYYVEGGCCSGIASQLSPGGWVDHYAQDEGNTFKYISTTNISNLAAQAKCCED